MQDIKNGDRIAALTAASTGSTTAIMLSMGQATA